MSSIAEVLNEFRSVTLKEMDRVRLMDRYDRKYIFASHYLHELLSLLTEEYNILEVNGKRISRYDSVYFDTPSLLLYHRHQLGRGNRFKIRYRKYVDSNISFFELKIKTNRERIVKHRIRQPDIFNHLTDDASLFLEKKTKVKASLFEPKLRIRFDRITLVHRNFPERSTIDIHLSVEGGGREKKFSNLVIAEIKQERTHRSPFAALLKKAHIREASFSKYCLGMASINKELRQNNFKPRLLQVKKIENDLSTKYGY
ncbi:MAG: polyphosphate polymerase domain-containing protein [Bacteroidia bacterium]|nr:polyphosphate polymerase domain-containing protein [Bacteroidia bacterium]MCZ2277999.1 polyphosphate polymerase domain-containing protein [Bacteroidia bacterium]